MAFLDEVEELERKAGGGIPRFALVGAAILVALVAVAAVAGLALPAGGGVEVYGQEGEASASQSDSPLKSGSFALDMGESSETQESSESSEKSYVHVVGAVNNPGVYAIASSARLNEAIEAAGGFTEDADLSAINLARTVVDGEQVNVPRLGQDPPQEAGSAPEAAPAADASAGTAAAPAQDSSGKVNINTADAAELQTLKGVGAATADKIIASREAEGPFTSPEDLKRVSGIGEKKYAALADSITV